MKWEINKEWWWDGNEEEVNEHSSHFNKLVDNISEYRYIERDKFSYTNLVITIFLYLLRESYKSKMIVKKQFTRW